MFTKQILLFKRLIILGHARQITKKSGTGPLLTIKKKDVEFYMTIFGLSNAKTTTLLKENGLFISANRKDVEESANFLKHSRKYSQAEIQEKPNVLLLNESTLDNRTKVLEECLFKHVLLSFLVRYVALMNKKVNILKAHDFINPEANIAKHLAYQLKLNVLVKDFIGENIALNELRKNLLDLYLKETLGCSNEDLVKLWRTYPRLKQRNFEYIIATVQILKQSLYFSNERIINNGYLLYANPKNIINLINEIPKIADHDIREILLRRPKILMSNCSSIQKILQHFKDFEIPDSAIIRCLEVLTLGPDTVHKRLTDLHKVSEFKVLCTHPRILRLVHYQTKAQTRLDYLNQLKVKCFSLHVLSSSSDTFEKYAREGVDRTKGKDVVQYLSKILHKDENELRNSLSRHPNWCHVSLLSVKASLDYLKYKKFEREEIYNNIHVLLYPINRIELKLNALLEWKSENKDGQKVSGVALKNISNEKLLGLCLYYIESEFHFTGDGIWAEPTAQIDAFPTNLPEFPKTLVKIYKYGMKPAHEIQPQTFEQAAL